MGMSRWPAAIAFASLAGCPSGISRRAECESVCKALDTCHLLPSVLGTTSTAESDGAPVGLEVNCHQRCERSPDDVRDPMITCAQDNDREPTFDDWCDPRGRCAELSACLRGKFPDVAITGAADLQVEPWTSVDCNESQPLPPGPHEACGAAGVTSVTGCPLSKPSPFSCLSARAFIDQGAGRQLGPPRACNDGPMRATFRNVVPGLWTVGVRVTVPEAPSGGSAGAGGGAGTGGNATTDGSAGTAGSGIVRGPSCREYTRSIEVRAGGATKLIAVLADPASSSETNCEICDDEADNNADGLVDCQDPQCVLECEKGRAPEPASVQSNAGGSTPAAGAP